MTAFAKPDWAKQEKDRAKVLAAAVAAPVSRPVSVPGTTISHEKDGEQVQVKRAGNFNRLLVIKISEQLEFEGRFIKRKLLSKGEGAYARVSWSNIPPTNDEHQA